MQLINSEYYIQDVPLKEIVKKFGTPLYLYDASKIVSQYHLLKSAFTSFDVKLKYACKASTNISIIKLLKKEGAGLDVVSIQEAYIGLKAGYSANEIMYTPNCVDFDELDEAVQLGFIINIDNLPLLEYFGQKYGNTVPCCLRVRPNIVAGGNVNIQVGHSRSKFGLPVEQMQTAKELTQKYNIRIVGLHTHSGSDIKEVDAFLKSMQIVFELAKQYTDLTFIDFGSGFKVAYKAGDPVTPLEELGKKMGIAYQQFTAEYGRALQIWFEPGKFLVSEGGYFVTTATVVKPTNEVTFVGLNSGFNHLIRPMLYNAHHEIFNASNPQGELKKYDVVGYICETDTFGQDRMLNEVKRGDTIVFKNGGAYGFSMASQYNSRYRPAEVLVINNEAKLIRERENLDDILQKQIDIFG
jgi:diaminopimelate decarboxylase